MQGEAREAMGVKILKFADERYAERDQKALKEERERLAESLQSRGFDESIIQEVLSFKKKDDGGSNSSAIRQT